MKKARQHRLTLSRETLRRLDARELTIPVAGSASLTLTACRDCDTYDCPTGEPGTSTLSCTQLVCIAA